MKRIFLFTALFVTLAPLFAQQPLTWEEAWQAYVTGDDQDDEDDAEDYELLAQLADHPLELNRATREELEQLPFLSAQQVMDLREYCDRYGPMRSLGELRMIRSLDYHQLRLLPFFVCVDPEAEMADTLRQKPQPHVNLLLTGRLPFYDRRGDRNGYLGYKYRHSLRCELTYGRHLRVGMVGAQDAGEPFFAGRNRWGYDAYSYYVQIDKKGVIEKAIVGKYKLSAGMGLVLNTSFSLGKLATLQTLGRQTNTLRAHTSRSEADYFQGAAATLAFGSRSAHKPLRLTLFASYRPIDGTLDAGGTLTNLTTTGYHRTKAEMARKHNTHLTAFGGRMVFTKGGWRAGLNGVLTHLDRSLQPSATVLYRRYNARGRHFANASMDYGYMHHRFSLSGETAIDGDGAVATINSASYQPSGQLAIVALWRFYSYRYNGLYSHSFGETGAVKNENGGFLGMKWNPLRNLHLQAYADYARFPWARYLVSRPSHAWDVLLQTDYQWRRWQLHARGRMRLRQRNSSALSGSATDGSALSGSATDGSVLSGSATDGSALSGLPAEALTANNTYRARLALTYAAPAGWSAKTQVDATRSVYLYIRRGWMLSEQLTLHRPAWQLSALAALFHTDDFASRVYLYERTLSHEFGSTSFYGEGLRLSLLGKADLCRRLRLTLRLGYTNYFDRPVIGSGLQQIDQSHQTDLDLQLRWRF